MTKVTGSHLFETTRQSLTPELSNNAIVYYKTIKNSNTQIRFWSIVVGANKVTCMTVYTHKNIQSITVYFKLTFLSIPVNLKTFMHIYEFFITTYISIDKLNQINLIKNVC
jgi:hypothetical protein